VAGMWSTAELFRVFGVGPFLGRALTDAEGFSRSDVRGEGASGTSVVILSHGYWRRRFGSDPNILGKPIRMGQGSPW